MTASNDLVARLRENAQDDLAAADCPHVCREAADRIEALEAEVARCHARLEIDHAFKADAAGEELVQFEIPYDERAGWPDAVSCRDATIGLQDERIDALTSRIEALEAALRWISDPNSQGVRGGLALKEDLQQRAIDALKGKTPT